MADDDHIYRPRWRSRRLDSMRSELFRDLNPQRRREIAREVVQSRINSAQAESPHALSPVEVLDYLFPGDEDETSLSGSRNRNSSSESPSGSNSTSRHHDWNAFSPSVQGWNSYRSLSSRPEPTQVLPYEEARRRLLGEASLHHEASHRAQPGHTGILRGDTEHGADTLRRDMDAWIWQSHVDQARETYRLRRLLISGERTSALAARPDSDEDARMVVAMAIATRRMSRLAGMGIGGTATQAWSGAHGRLRRRDSDEETLPPYSPPHAEDLEDPPPAYTPAVNMSPGGSIEQLGDTVSVEETTREPTGNGNQS